MKTYTFDARPLALGDIVMLTSTLKATRAADHNARIKIAFKPGFHWTSNTLLDGLAERLNLERLCVEPNDPLTATEHGTIIKTDYIEKTYPQRPELLSPHTLGKTLERLHFVDAMLAYMLPQTGLATNTNGRTLLIENEDQPTTNLERFNPEIPLTDAEHQWATDYLNNLTRNHGNRPYLALGPTASCESKTIEQHHLETLIHKTHTEKSIIYLQLAPGKLASDYGKVLPGKHNDKDFTLRQSAAILAHIQGGIHVDTFTLHASAAVRRTPLTPYTKEAERFPTKTIGLMFSSNPESVMYAGDIAYPLKTGKLQHADTTLPCRPCGNHNYAQTPIDTLERAIGATFIKTTQRTQPDGTFKETPWLCIHKPEDVNNVQPCRAFNVEELAHLTYKAFAL